MIPDLGKYAVPVLSAYGVSLALLALIIWSSLSRGRKVKKQLEDYEAKRKSNGAS